MNKKFLIVIISTLALISMNLQAQEVVFEEENTPYSHPEVLVHVPPASEDNVIVQNTSFDEKITDEPMETPAKDEKNDNHNISNYAQKLNLTAAQLEKAQKINIETHARQEQILQDIESLRKQAHELENKSLTDFEAILTEEQRILFHQLKDEDSNEKISESEKVLQENKVKITEELPEKSIEVSQQKVENTVMPDENIQEIKLEVVTEPELDGISEQLSEIENETQPTD